MSLKSPTKRLQLSLEWIYRISVVAAIILMMAIIQYCIDGYEYANDKHSALVNLAVLLFSVLIIETLTSAKGTATVRRADEQRILGFHKLLSVYLHRYLQAADAMTRPIESFLADSTFNRELLAIEFTDMVNMYNVSLNKFVSLDTKSYIVYFNASIELGDTISRGLAYVYSSQHSEIANTLIALATNTNSLDMQMLQQGFKDRERSRVGTTPMIDSDRAMFNEIRLGNIKQTVDFIDFNSHSLSAYARTYKLLMSNIKLIEQYRSAIEAITNS